MNIRELKQSLDEIKKILRSVKKYEKRTKVLIEFVDDDNNIVHLDIKSIIYIVSTGNVVIRTKTKKEMIKDGPVKNIGWPNLKLKNKREETIIPIKREE